MRLPAGRQSARGQRSEEGRSMLWLLMTAERLVEASEPELEHGAARLALRLLKGGTN